MDKEFKAIRERILKETEDTARELMRKFYQLRSMCPVDDEPEAWILIPEAQTMLHKIQRNIQLTKESLHG
jgi:hypothetical protein